MNLLCVPTRLACSLAADGADPTLDGLAPGARAGAADSGRRRLTGWLRGALVALAASPMAVHADAHLTEADFLADLPIVLSVSRLPQPLDETPGAVTLLDREMIRNSGARDLPDLLRLVPGFRSVASFEADAPSASYHSFMGSYATRIQVLVDGQSVYSSYFFGSVGPGLMSVPLDDVERVEVFRGSNSAAYGARAMLGVINVVTRRAADVLAPRVKLAQGENGVQDRMVGMGWSLPAGALRLTLSRQSDDGLTNANGENLTHRMSVRADLATGPQAQLELRAGAMRIEAGRGFANRVSAPLRDTAYASQYAQADWRISLDRDQDLALSFAYNHEDYLDVSDYKPVPGVRLDYSGQAHNLTLALQHTRRFNEALRLVWGGELRRESVNSTAVFNTPESLTTDFRRLFANLEWRLQPDWLLNLGAMAEHSSDFGASLAPRWMLNWRVAPGQTLRGGVSKAYRPPSKLETDGDIRYVLDGRLLQITLQPLGNARPEEVLTRELGYLAQWPALASTVDVRVYDEAVRGLIQRRYYSLPAGTTLLRSEPYDYVNGDSFSLRGVEVQWNARPWKGGQWGLSLARSKLASDGQLADPLLLRWVPRSAQTLFASQELGAGWRVSLSHQHQTATALPADSARYDGISRTDLQLARSFRLGSQRAAVALVLQNQGPPYSDYNKAFLFEKRAFLVFRLND